MTVETLERASSDAERAALSLGQSSAAIHRRAAAIVARRGSRGTLVDVGCGDGKFYHAIANDIDRYIGCDLVRYDGFPTNPRATFIQADLNQPPYPIDRGAADVVTSIETVEHLENPRAFFRELARIARPGGLVVVTTPNQLSLLSKLTLLTKNQFNAFQEGPGLYPTHITALVEADLRHIAQECGFNGIEIEFTDHGRIPFTAWHFPRRLGFRGRWFSDNVLLSCLAPK